MRPADLSRHVRAALDHSNWIRSVQLVAADGGLRFALQDRTARPLSPAEIEQLQLQGNAAEDWSRVKVDLEFNVQSVRHSSFYGDVVLGRFSGTVPLAAGVRMPAGIFRSAIADSVIGPDCLVYNVGLVARYVVGAGCVLSGCGEIIAEGSTCFGNGYELPIAIETGGREVRVYAELDVAAAAVVAQSSGRRDWLSDYSGAVSDYVQRCTSHRGIIEARAAIRHTSRVRNVYLGPHAEIDSATYVDETTMLSSAEEPARIETGACVSRSLIQWGSRIATGSIVDRTLLTEHSQVERHGKVTASILGPNTRVAEGEVTSCLLGPCVGFHHQALLIAALWPDGKGNVGYGANIGSNHTSKAPDQELWLGEGNFLGLGVNIKYPADYSRAPYTIIATGVTTLPQKVTFPFSLINNVSSSFPGVSPAYNELVPAWVLIDNIFALKRNEWKYEARNRARRMRIDFAVFRPPIIDLMLDARNRLRAVNPSRDLYTDREIDGLGKNFMLESSRGAAIDAYEFYIKLYGLMGLMREVKRLHEIGLLDRVPVLLVVESADACWEHGRGILCGEFGMEDVVAALAQLPEMLRKVAGDVERSKAKDDQRGARIIDDYADVHTPAARDQFIQGSWEETKRLQRELADLIVAIQQSARSSRKP